ncbi:MAG: TonB-dependent receptor [Rhodanobacteraceae bacterium]|nr:MAG: TonB-dependent receptor [Rhodanobacteraceae bacterium]
MRLDRSELSKAVQTALSLGAVAAVGVAGTAFAQTTTPAQSSQNQPQTLQTIVVTGSHIRRVDLETSNPVVAITSQQIQATGKLTLGDVVQNLPVITGGVENPSVNNGGATGQTLVGLRGLGASRTLVLVDGQRIINNDLNSIPTAAVERIEVLTDGASAIYGSDAIGGVINIILKSNYQGAQFTANYGISDHNDGERKGVSFVFGQTSDKGSILAGIDYNKFDPIMQAARKFSANALSMTATNTYGSKQAYGGSAPPGLTYLAQPGSGWTTFVGGSSFALRNRIFLPASAKANLPASLQGCSSLSLNSGTFAAGADPTTSDYHCFGTDPATGQSDRYNYASVNYLLTPQERTNAFFKGVYHLTDNIDFYGTVYHEKTSSGSQFAPAVVGTGPLGFNTGLKISAQNYYNPFGVDFTPSGATYTGRMVPAGPRNFAGAITTDQLIFGFRGNINLGSRNWTWDVGENYGHVRDISTDRGLPNQTILNEEAGPSFMNTNPANGPVNTVMCGTAAAPISLGDCTPFDPFNLNNPNTIAVIQAASSPALADDYSIERIYHADVSGGLFDLPAGTVQLAAGASYRKEYTNNVVSSGLLLNPATGTCVLGSACGAHLQGGYNVKEVYAEAFIPILKDMPFAHVLNLTLGDRYSKYSTFGSTTNWKIGLEYRPINDLLLRGTVSRVFRAPGIGAVFASPTSSAPILTSDPCDHITAPNPACQFVPTDGTFVNTLVASHQQIKALNSGSEYAHFPLGPEKGKSFDFGAVYSPHFVPGLTVQADLWRIYLNNVITGVTAQTILNSCFNGLLQFCPLITRTNAPGFQGQLSQVLQPTANLGRLDTRGVDFAANYKLPDFAFGQFSIGLQATYLSEFKIQTAPGIQGVNQVRNAPGMFGGFGTSLGSSCPFAGSGVCFFPRVRAQGTLDWQLGPWNAQWTMRYNSPFRSGSPNPAEGDTALSSFPSDGPAGPLVLHYGSFTYNDVMVGYNIAPLNTTVQVGVDNVFDKQPPMLYANNVLNANTDPGDFDTIGRYYWARMTVNF